jgi:hypothetical protein
MSSVGIGALASLTILPAWALLVRERSDVPAAKSRSQLPPQRHFGQAIQENSFSGRAILVLPRSVVTYS